MPVLTLLQHAYHGANSAVLLPGCMRNRLCCLFCSYFSIEIVSIIIVSLDAPHLSCRAATFFVAPTSVSSRLSSTAAGCHCHHHHDRHRRRQCLVIAVVLIVDIITTTTIMSLLSLLPSCRLHHCHCLRHSSLPSPRCLHRPFSHRPFLFVSRKWR